MMYSLPFQDGETTLYYISFMVFFSCDILQLLLTFKADLGAVPAYKEPEKIQLVHFDRGPINKKQAEETDEAVG